MRIFILLLSFLFFSGVKTFSQNKVIFHLKSINKTDSLGGIDFSTNLVKPRSFTINANPLSPVTEITELNGYIIAIQLEILKSKLENIDHLIAGLVIYKKQKGSKKWEMLQRHEHWPLTHTDGNIGMKGSLIAGTGIWLVDHGDEYELSYELHIN